MSSRLMDILHPTKNSIFLIWGLTSDTLSPNPRGEGRLTLVLFAFPNNISGVKLVQL